MTNTKRQMLRNGYEQESRLADDFYRGAFTCEHGVDTCSACIGTCVHRCDECMLIDMERRQETK